MDLIRTNEGKMRTTSAEETGGMSDLKQDLASLRLERGNAPRDTEPSRGWLRRLLPLVLILALAAAGYYGWQKVRPSLTSLEVETVQAAVVTPEQASEAPILSASGYVVARRKAVVSAKIQGRLSWLKGEEGIRVSEN